MDGVVFIDSLKKIINSHPTLVTLFLYLFASFIGMCYEVFLLSEFNIYVFHYTKIYEYFLSAFKAYEITLFVTACFVLIFYLLYKNPKNQKGKIRLRQWSINISILALFLVMILSPYFIAMNRADYLQKNTDRFVNVVIKEKEIANSLNIQFNKLILISSSERYFFFYNRKTIKPIIIPADNILLLEYE